jgi:hypothetical protein
MATLGAVPAPTGLWGFLPIAALLVPVVVVVVQWIHPTLLGWAVVLVPTILFCAYGLLFHLAPAGLYLWLAGVCLLVGTAGLPRWQGSLADKPRAWQERMVKPSFMTFWGTPIKGKDDVAPRTPDGED